MNPGPPTLPDHLRPGLTVVFIGINPGLYSAQRGHYFARRNSRFWPAFSASLLSEPVRRKLGVQLLQPEHDCKLPDFGFGLTDLVKRVSANASHQATASKQAEFDASRAIQLAARERAGHKLAAVQELPPRD